MTQEKIQTSISGDGNSDEKTDLLSREEIAPYWLEALIDSADDAIISKTLDGIISSWNKGAEHIFGYSAEEVIGKSILILIPPGLQSEEPLILSRIRAGERIEHFETVRIRKDGSPVNISLTVSPIKNPEGRIIGVSKIARDVSESKKSEARLRESEERFAKAFNSSPLVLTISSLETGKLLEVNETFVNVTGFSREEAIGRTTIELGLWAKPADREEEMEIVRQDGFIRNTEYIFHTKKGTIIGLLSAEHIEIGGESFALTVIQDVTERKRAGEKLRQSDERYRMLFNSIDQGFCLCEMIFDDAGKPIDYRFLEVNPVFEKMTGISNADALTGKTARELVPNLEDKWVQIYGKIALTGEPIRFVDGSDAMNGRWFDVYAFRVGGETSRKVAIFFNNITERKKAEEKLRESEERFRQLADNAPVMVWVTESDGYCSFLSKSWYEFTGQTPETGLGYGWLDATHPEDRARAEEAFTNANENGEVFRFEYRLLRKDGVYRWAIDAAAPHRSASGEFLGYIGSVIDITERKKVEFALIERERLARFNAAISAALVENNSLPAILNLCAESIVNSLDAAFARVWTLNPAKDVLELQASAGMYKHLDGEHARIPVGKYKIGQIAAERRPHLTNSVIGDERVSNQEWAKRENIVAFAGYPLIVEGRLVGVVAMFARKSLNEATLETLASVASMIALGIERKENDAEREELLQREQIARQQAEEASRLKDEFLATVSHEIRTPLNAILGWSQMLISNKINPNDISGAIQTIYRNAKSQAQLIEDILDVSRIITGKIRLEPRRISLAPLIQTAVESLRPAIEAKNIRLQMRLDFEPRTVNADPNRFQQVIWNLVSNAIKFTPEKGSVSIELESDAAQTKIIVSDTGKGIDAKFLPFVFERFRQADGSSTRQHGGLGLGLAIVRHIVELHGGRVDVSSAGDAQGTTFTVCLPLAESAAADLKKSESENLTALKSNFSDAETGVYNNKIKGLRILLIDDEADTLELLGVILNQSGALVKAAANVADALETIKGWLPDVIISDIAMPDEDGYSFIKKLRMLPAAQGGTIPAIALTAYVGIKERTQILSSGFQMYVPKPIEPSELVGALENFV